MEKFERAPRECLAALLLLGLAGPSLAQVPSIGPGAEMPVAFDPGSSSATGLERLEQRLAQEHPEVPAAAVAKAFGFLRRHPVSNRQFVAIADFDRPSDEPRLSIVRMSDGSVERFKVAHGSGSGGRWATRFSNAGQSHESSLGVYLTGDEYEGKHGRSLKLRGMEAGNSKAEARSIVLHGASYVSRGGRSWGCPAVDYGDRDHIIDELHGGAILLIYSSRQQ